MTTAIDPTRVRHEGFLLSEFVGNHSVYYHGLPNPVQTDVWTRGSCVIVNWLALGGMLSLIRETIGGEGGCKAFSIGYGWIHPRVSAKIVSWKNPTHPSYHRWDMGAACDINFHAMTFVPYQLGLSLTDHNMMFSPLSMAASVNRARPRDLDRTITYSESPYICFATGHNGMAGHAKWYENRFQGIRGVKPHFITYRGGRAPMGTPDTRPLEVDWRGGGWPSHHGGGKRQYQHIRTSLYTVMSDWLYDRDRVHFGRANRMPMSTARYDLLKRAMHFAGAVFDVIQATCLSHVAIIDGLKIDRRGSNWEEEGVWSFTVTAPDCEGQQFYERIVDEILPQYREALGILGVSQEGVRPYLSPTGRALAPVQSRVLITGAYNGTGSEQFDFDTAARSAEFRENSDGGGRASDSDSEGMVTPRTRTRRRRSQGESRRSVRTRTFRGEN